MAKVTYICIGVQKAGTTSLINYLSQHPEIYIKTGESHFFDKPKDHNITSGEIQEYENSFNTNKLIIGEKTPSYNYLYFCMDRIYNYNPNIKLILLLKEPIARAYSQYNMTLNFKNKTLNDVRDEDIIKDFEEHEHTKFLELTSNGDNFIIRGKYDEILTYILSKFPKENVYVGISEEIRTNKQKYYNDIFKFLGVKDKNDIPINVNVDVHHRTYAKPISKIVAKKLYNVYKPHNENLYKILGRKIDIWENYYDELLK